jgi:L-fuculose-phosphate aldolase
MPALADGLAPGPELIECMRELSRSSLSVGSSGNASQRSARGMWISPTGILPARMGVEDLVELDLSGTVLRGTRLPSSEWPMHAAIYDARPDAHAIVHCHSRHATALACLGQEIPAFHYMVAAAGGDSIRCAPYALFGSSELAAHALDALHGRKACLLGNHGQIAIGASLDEALRLAAEVEELAAQYWTTLAAGTPRLLGAAEMNQVLQRFASYGQQNTAPAVSKE